MGARQITQWLEEQTTLAKVGSQIQCPGTYNHLTLALEESSPSSGL